MVRCSRQYLQLFSSSTCFQNVSEVVESTFDSAQVPLPEMSVSPIWQPSVRSEVKQTKLSEQELNQKRSKNLVPGNNIR